MMQNEIIELWAADNAVLGQQDDLSELSRDIGKLHSKYLDIYNRLKNKKITAEQTLRKLTGLKWKWYQGLLTKQQIDQLGWDYDPWNGQAKPVRADLEKYYLDCDTDLTDLQQIVEQLDQQIDITKRILDVLHWKPQSIRNQIEWRKFVAGQ